MLIMEVARALRSLGLGGWALATRTQPKELTAEGADGSL